MADDALHGLPLPTCPLPSLPEDVLNKQPQQLSPWFIISSRGAAGNNSTLHLDFPHPNSSLTLSLLFLVTLGLGIYTAVHCSSVVILNRRNSHPSLVNRFWTLFFLVISSSFAIDFIRYTLDTPFAPSSVDFSLAKVELYRKIVTKETDSRLLLLSAIGRRLAAALLFFALNHHKKHRLQG
jgi:hypothetical protein